METTMNEDKFNSSLRGFLKKVGITSQREIEKAIRDAVSSGRLKGNEKLPAKMVLTIGGVGRTSGVAGELGWGEPAAVVLPGFARDVRVFRPGGGRREGGAGNRPGHED